MTAAVSLARTGPQKTPTARKRAEAAAVKETSEVLGNTLAVARSSYIDPRILDHYAQGRTGVARRVTSRRRCAPCSTRDRASPS